MGISETMTCGTCGLRVVNNICQGCRLDPKECTCPGRGGMNPRR